MKDIEHKKDIILLVDTFYEKVLKDERIGYIFIEVANLDIPAHMPRMYQFWSGILLGDNEFKGNPMTAHIQLHQKESLLTTHFERWLALWHQTVDELFSGTKADEAKSRAQSIAALMQYHINQ